MTSQSGGRPSWTEQLRQPRTWATLLVVVLVGGLWLWNELDGTEPSGPGDHSSLTSGPSASVSGATDRPSARPSAGTTSRPSVTARPSPPSGRPSSRPSSRPTSAAPSAPSRDPVSGLEWIDAEALPVEGRETLTAIDNGGPFVREKDGSTFGNYEGELPSQRRGYYAEYTVPTPGVSHAGARRIITGDGGEYYWTEDHYRSFERIRR